MSVKGEFKMVSARDSNDVNSQWCFFPYETIIWLDPDYAGGIAQGFQVVRRDENDNVIGTPTLNWTITGEYYNGSWHDDVEIGTVTGKIRTFEDARDWSAASSGFLAGEKVKVRGQFRSRFYSGYSGTTFYASITNSTGISPTGNISYGSSAIALPFNYEIPELKEDGTVNICSWLIGQSPLPQLSAFALDNNVYISHPRTALNAYKFDREYPYTWDFDEVVELGDDLYLKTPQGLIPIKEYMKTETGLRPLYSFIKTK